MKFIFLTIGLTLGVIVLSAVAMLRSAAGGFSVRQAPSRIEKYLAGRVRKAAIPAADEAMANPIAESAEVLAQARAHWADHCANCHANNGSGDTAMGRNLYPPAPDMRGASTQELSDGELFYIIENGIRMTGMPAWGGPGHSPDDSWKLVRFIRHLPQMGAEEAAEMQKMNPRTPAELEEEHAEDEFLKGEDPHAQHHAHH